jgi:hypothetical protein
VKELVFTGGTGRSGSTIVGHLLDHHPDFVLSRPMEVRFLTGNDGFIDALRLGLKKPGSQRASQAAALAGDRLLERWYYRAEHVGLHTAMAAEDIERSVYEYLATFDTAPLAATRKLSDTIFAAVAETLRPGRLVDTTPANARKADLVEPLYPDSKVIIVIRDGRDVAASFTKQSFGPDDVFEALEQWGKRMLKCHQAAQLSKPERVHIVDLADLVRDARVQSLQDLMTFLGSRVDPQMQAWFDAEMSANGAHIGRWRTDFDAQTASRIDERYAELTAELAEQGVRIPK